MRKPFPIAKIWSSVIADRNVFATISGASSPGTSPLEICVENLMDGQERCTYCRARFMASFILPVTESQT